MADQVRDMLVRVNGDTSGLKRAMSDGQDSSDKANKSLQGFKDNLNKVAVGLTAVGVGITAYAVSATNFTIDYVRDAKTLSRTTGETVQEASRLSYAIGQLGLDAGSVSVTLTTFSKKIAGAKDDAADANNAFQRLGVSVNDSNGKLRPMSDVLLDISDKFKAMPNGIEKNTAAIELFGKSGPKLIPFLNKGRDGIAEMEAQADKLGLTLTDKTVGAVDKLRESQKQLQATQDGLKLQIGTLTAPVLTAFNKKFAEMLQLVSSTDGPFKGLLANVLAFGGPVSTAAGGLAGFAANLIDVGDKAPKVGNALGLIGKGLGWATLVIAAGVALVYLLNQLGLLQPMIDWVTGSLKSLGEWVQTNIIPIVNQATAAFREWYNIFVIYVLPILKDVYNFMVGQMADAWRSIQQSVKAASDALAPFIDKGDQLKLLFFVLLAPLAVVVAAIFVFIGVIAMVIIIIARVIQFIAALISWYLQLSGTVTKAMGDFVKATVDTGAKIIQWFQKLPGEINKSLGDMGSFLFNSGKALIEGLGKGIAAAADGVKNTAKGVLNNISKLFPRSPAEEGPFSGRGWTLYSGMAIPQALAEGIEVAGSTAVDSMNKVMSNVSDVTANPLGVDVSGQVIPIDTSTAALQAATQQQTTQPAGPTINITVAPQFGIYAGMPVEKRQVAVELWTEIVREARSQGVILPNIGVQTQ